MDDVVNQADCEVAQQAMYPAATFTSYYFYPTRAPKCSVQPGGTHVFYNTAVWVGYAAHPTLPPVCREKPRPVPDGYTIVAEDDKGVGSPNLNNAPYRVDANQGCQDCGEAPMSSLVPGADCSTEQGAVDACAALCNTYENCVGILFQGYGPYPMGRCCPLAQLPELPGDPDDQGIGDGNEKTFYERNKSPPSMPPPPPPYAYMQGAIGTTCADNGLQDVANFEECKAAKIALGYSDTTFPLQGVTLDGFPLCYASNDVGPYEDENTELGYNSVGTPVANTNAVPLCLNFNLVPPPSPAPRSPPVAELPLGAEVIRARYQNGEITDNSITVSGGDDDDAWRLLDVQYYSDGWWYSDVQRSAQALEDGTHATVNLGSE